MARNCIIHVMMVCIVLLVILLLALSNVNGDDRLLLGSSLQSPKTLISRNNTVELGFFSVSNESYLGISYYNATKDVVALWIANRNNPVSLNASLHLTTEGRLDLIDGSVVVWSAVPAGNTRPTQAVLLDSANFILTTGNSQDVLHQDNATMLWQSFEHPADVWVPGMKMFLGSNLTSWNSKVSPSSGRYIMQMLQTTEYVISPVNSTSTRYWTSGRWDDNLDRFSAVPQMTNQYLYKFTFNSTARPKYFIWYEKDFKGSIFRLEHDGSIRVKWLDSGQWTTVFTVPSLVCNADYLCGVNSRCDSQQKPPCSCTPGFKPANQTDWNNENWSQGCVVSPDTSGPPGSSSSNSGAIIGIAVGSAAGGIAVISLAVVIILRRKRVRRQKVSTLGKATSFVGGELTPFTYKQLYHATEGFKCKLGSGGFGEVFKGSIQGEPVAVKRLIRFDDKQFRAEVSTIGTVQHINLVMLRGFCADASLQRLLVYEFVANGSLDASLFGSSKLLDWKTRFGIAVGTAKGIAYLHEECRDRILHCDIKPENILLDEEGRPKVADFGLAKLMGREFSRVVTSMRGTRGYLAPEWLSNAPITPKADVYSYGMTLLEIISGRRNIDIRSDRVFFPLFAATEVAAGRFENLPDERLNGEWNMEELQRAAKTAIWCVQDEEAKRPGMMSVVHMLEGSDEDLPDPPIPNSFLEIE